MATLAATVSDSELGHFQSLLLQLLLVQQFNKKKS